MGMHTSRNSQKRFLSDGHIDEYENIYAGHVGKVGKLNKDHRSRAKKNVMPH